jgi:hypothetical protein
VDVDGRAEAEDINTKVTLQVHSALPKYEGTVSKCHCDIFIGAVERRGFEASSQNKVLV